MNIAVQIDGERLAKDVVAESKAMEVLSLSQRSSYGYLTMSFGFFVLIGTGAVLGWLSSLAPSPGLNLGTVAGAGLGLGMFCFQTIVQLQRRLDAAVALLLLRKAHSSL